MLLFIHPRTEMLLKEILPMGLPALINRLGVPVRGRFHDEWTPAEVRQADLILMDVHWYLGLKSVLDLARRFKRINPRAPIIVGGMAASLFASRLVRDAPIDYVIRGDADQPLPQLVAALLNQTPVTTVPNLVARDFVSPATYTLTPQDLDAGNYRDITFFPEYERRVLSHHRSYRGLVTIPVYPYLVVYRGCPLDCPMCCGSSAMQPSLFGRAGVVRSADQVREDLRAWSADGRLRFVNAFHDFVTPLPAAYAERVLSERYRLFISWEFFKQPTQDQLELLMSAFEGGKLLFPLDHHHNATPQLANVSGLIQRLKQAQAARRYQVVLGYVGRYLADPAYRAALRQVKTETGVALYKVDSWWDEFPLPGMGEVEYRQFIAWHNRYYWVNRIFRAGVQVYRLSPWLAKSASHWLLERVKI